jgi:adenylate cyclase class 2
MIEVEAKFLIADLQHFRTAIERFAASNASSQFVQEDEYFHHPCRDFTKTDEAFRIRVSNGEVLITYKGPRLDLVTKSREEIELPITSSSGVDGESNLRAILHALGFRSAGIVCKKRESFDVPFDGHVISVSIDEVSGLPCYAELEIAGEESARDAATKAILGLAESLGLTQNERRSYLELLGF